MTRWVSGRCLWRG